ncbi:MAG TPA: WD40 repeat domain-containing protein, partial [Planctomycetota bacterium]|nr:WD40 repeat domain-containing protein [Planctomycetota bacterium]
MTRLGLALALLAIVPQDPPQAVDALGDPIPAGAHFRLGSRRFQHADPIKGLRYSRDGKRIFSASWFSIRAWDAGDGRNVGKIVGGQGTLEAMAVSPDGRTVYSTGCNVLYTLAWDVETGKEKFRLQGPGDGPNFTGGADPVLSISDDGKRLATAMRDDSIRVWDLEKRREIFKRVTVDGQKLASAGGLSISGDGRLVAAIAADAMYVFEIDTGKVALKVTGSMRINPTFSPDGKRIAVSGVVRAPFEIWDIAEARKVCEFKTSSSYKFRWSPDGQSGVWWETGALVIGNTSTGESRRRIEGQFLGQFDFSPDGRTLATASSQTIRLFEIETGREITDPRRGGGAHWSMGVWNYSPDGRVIASVGINAPIRFWDPRTGREVSRIDHSASVTAMAFSPDGRTLATFECEYEKQAIVRRWDVLTGRQVGKIDLDTKIFKYQGSFSPDARHVLNVSQQPAAMVDAVTGAVFRTFPGSVITALSPDGKRALLRGKRLAVVDLDSEKELWSVDIRKLSGENQGPAFFSPDGRELFFCMAGVASVADAATGKTLREIPVDPAGVEYFYYSGLSHDAKLILIQSYDAQRVEHWDALKPGKPKRFTFDEKPASVRFAPDGSSWATGMYDSTILVWKLKPDLPPAVPATDIAALWERCGSTDIVEAWGAADAMSASRDAGVFLKEKLKDRLAGAPRAPEAMRKVVAKLADDDIEVREKAQVELRAAGDAAEGALIEGIDAQLGADAEVVIRKLLDVISARAPGSGDGARRMLAIKILERTGAEGRAILETLR